jgi:hypothetical protein
MTPYERLEYRLMDALSDRDRVRQEMRTLSDAINRYADTLILDQPLDEAVPLRRAIVAADLRSFLDFATNGGILR